jgi:hypothetical protein
LALFKALSEMINRGFVVEDTIFHRSIQVFIKEFEFGHGFTQMNTD